MTTQRCFRKPILEIMDAARYLDAAVEAHLQGHFALAEQLIYQADIPAIADWAESIWGKKSPYVKYKARPLEISEIAKEQRTEDRMPTTLTKKQLLKRDGYHCRFCGAPVIRSEIRQKIRKAYPKALRWSKKNAERHSAFQVLWVQYDHVFPHSKGGSNEFENLVITCAPCNYGRMNYTLEEVGLSDPRNYPPIQSTWDGLERFIALGPYGF